MIAALGNPGERYEGTRHNAGRWLLEKMLAVEGLQLKRGLRVRGQYARYRADDHEVIFFIPSGYMNECGLPIARSARYFGVKPEHLIILHDELDFKPGEARFKIGGGHGGHNGLRDLIQKLGSREFLRLRIGIGHPGQDARVDKYVLTRPPTSELTLIRQTIEQLLDYQAQIMQGDFEALMQIFHR